MRGARAFGVERRTLFREAQRLLPLLIFLLVLAAPVLAQVPSDPAFVNIGPGANQTYWTNNAQFLANWGPSNFNGSVGPNNYGYEINTHPTDMAFGVVTTGQTPPSASPPPSLMIPGPGLMTGTTYYFWVRALGLNAVGQPINSNWVRSRIFTADFTAPTVTISSSSGSISTKAAFTVSWSITATSTVPLDHYDVAYRINGGPLRPWLTRTQLTSASFTGDNGANYTFQVTVTDAAGLTGTATTMVAINVLGASLALTASPSSLSFGGTDALEALSLDIGARGGSVNVTDIRESRTYSSWPQEDGGWEGMPMSLAGGTDQVISRSVLLSVLQRSKALGGGSTGSFDLILTVRGKDGIGNDVQGSVTVPVTVSSAPPSTLTLIGASVEVPASPYNLGDTVNNARVHLTASGTGTVTGQVLVDGSTSWSGTPAFTVTITGNTVFDVLGNLPTSVAGSHTVRVDISSPVSLSSQTTYTVSSTPPSFPPSSLDLIKGVAQLTGLSGKATAVSSAGYTDYTFTGSATLTLPSLGSLKLPGFTVTSIVVRMFDNLSPPQIKGGSAEIDAGGGSPLTDFAGGYLKIRKIAFDFGKAADHLSIDAAVVIPNVAQELFTAKDMVLDSTGISNITLSLDTNHALSFTLFGMTFSIHDVLGGGSDDNKAIAFGKADGGKGYYIGISGGISMQEKQGVNTTQKDLATFRNVDLRFYTDGSLDGNIKLTSPFDLIPKDLTLDSIAIAQASKTYSLTLSGTLKNLPAPLDKTGDLPVSFTIDTSGNGSVSIPAINKLKPGGKGHSLQGKSDPTEWDLGLAALNLTYLSLDLSFTGGVLDLDHSQVSLAVDLYLKLNTKEGGSPSDDDRRISFGDLDNGGKLQGGIVIDFAGKITWSVPGHIEVLKDKRLAFGPVELAFDKVSIDPSPFALVITGSIAVDLDGISGGIDFDNLKIGLDGTMGDIGAAVSNGGGGKLSVMDAVSIEVDTIAWSSSPTTITLSQNTSTGSGENMTPNKQSNSVNVDSYFSMKGASITLGSGSDSIMSGGFDELTVYTLAAKDGGGTGFVVRNAKLSVSDALDVTADMEYSPSPLSFLFAGSLSLPSVGVDASAVGKVGTLNGKPSFGLFVIAELGPGIPIGPGVFLDELGGGFFVNPSDDDIALVRKIANFQRPEMSDEVSARRPGGASNSQSFALMVLAGFSVAEKNLVSGRALMTITSSYFNLDAEVSLIDGLADGKVYLAVSWNPAYAEGKITAEMAFPTHDDALVSGSGDLEFYFYPGVWGIDGKMQIKVLGINIAQGEMFVGTPGFMVQATVGAGIDLGIVSGSISMGGMFWYYGPTGTLGAYAQVDLKGSFLAGLFSAEAGLEGALIITPSFLLYAVGSLSVDVLGVTVFDGSLWFSVSGNGLDGGTGRNAQYDALIAQAKDMAHSLKAAKDALAASLEQAKLQLAQLTDEQAGLAGLILTEQQKAVFGNLPVDAAFDQYESNKWGGVPEPFITIRGVLFGPQAKALVQARAQLLKTKSDLDALLTDLEALRKDVSKRLTDYQDILVEPLPSVKDVGTLGNPFQGMLEKTVTVGGKTKTVKSGFVLDATKADMQKTTLSTTRESFAQYQEAFIEAAGGIDARLQKLDEILFQGDANLTALNQRFAQIHSSLSKFTDDFVQFQGQSIAYATSGQQTIEGLQANVQDALDVKAKVLGASPLGLLALGAWNSSRIQLISQLVQAGDPSGKPYAPDTSVSPQALFDVTGYELWLHMPDAGFAASVAASQKSMPDLIKSFSKSSATLLKNWGDATDLTDQVFQRKADLYGLLYEIYDQLAFYGSGNIGIAGDGNAAGFKGIAALGLSFRASALSKAVSSKSVALPKGMAPPSSPTFGPNRSLQKSVLPAPAQKPAGPIMYAPMSMVLARLPGIGAGFGLSPSIQLKEVPAGMPSKGVLDRSVISIPSAIITPVAWVPVTTYFAAKRAEIAPYLVIPQVSVMNGSASSSSELEALLHASFNGTHPIGVVEYEYRIEPISTDTGQGAESLYKSFFHTDGKTALPVGLANPSFIKKAPVSVAAAPSLYSMSPSVKQGGQVVSLSNVLSQGKGGGAVATVLMPGSLKALILSTTPWLSVGGVNDINFLFIPQMQDPGTYALFLKVRGAGGKSIIRQGRFKVGYATPGQKVPVTAGMDTSDTTPPTTPVVTLSGAATSNKETLYAKWSADDQYSGIQGYQYAVEEYTDQTAKAGTGAVEGTPQAPQGKLVNKVMNLQQATTSTVQYFQSGGPLVSAQEAASHKWVDAQGRTEANIRGLSLEQAKRYVVWVMATNGVGRASIGRSDPIVVDAVPPDPPQITAFQQTSADGRANSVTFTFTPGTDTVSGISGHSFALGLSDKDQKAWPWTVAQGTSATIVNLPLAKGQQVTLQVKAVSGAGLESTATKSITIAYTGAKPPVPSTVVTKPQNFMSNTSQLDLTWSPASDPDSGIVGYEYAVGTSPAKTDVLSWTSAAGSSTPYLLGQGPQGSQGNQDMKATASVSLKDKGTYYGLVRATSGSGLSAIGASSAVVVDLAPPEVTLTAKAENPGTDRIAVDVSAKDPISGVARYRARVWQMKGPVSERESESAIAVPVMGWASQGTFQGSMQSRGLQLAIPPVGQAWYTTAWLPITNAAPPTSIDIQVVITGFPAPGLEIGKYYRVTVETASGSGVSAESNAAVIKVVAAAPSYQFAPRFMK